jgi:hypothetical protein
MEATQEDRAVVGSVGHGGALQQRLKKQDGMPAGRPQKEERLLLRLLGFRKFHTQGFTNKRKGPSYTPGRE